MDIIDIIVTILVIIFTFIFLVSAKYDKDRIDNANREAKKLSDETNGIYDSYNFGDKE